MGRKRLLQKIEHEDIVFKLYRDPFFHSSPFCVQVVGYEKGDIEPYWLAEGDSWATKAEALAAVQKAIDIREGKIEGEWV